MKQGDIIKDAIAEVGERSFDPKELFSNIRPLQIVWCWGATAWTHHKDKFLRFKSNGFKHKGHVYITLGWDDTFTIIYTTIRGKVLAVDKGIYIDMLINSIDNRIETESEFSLS